MKKILLILPVLVFSKMAVALTSNAFVIVDLLSDDAYLYSVALKKQDKPKINKVTIKDWGLKQSVEKYLHDSINASVSDDEIAFDKINVLPANPVIYKQLSLDDARQVLPGGMPNQPGRGAFYQNVYLRKTNIEKLVQYGEKLHADTVVAVYPAKGFYPIKKIDFNRFLYATPPGEAFIYAENQINSASSLWLILVDVKTKRVLEMQPGYSFDKVVLPSRVLTESEINEIKQLVGGKINVDFSKPLTYAAIEKIHEAASDDDFMLDKKIHPLHHTLKRQIAATGVVA